MYVYVIVVTISLNRVAELEHSLFKMAEDHATKKSTLKFKVCSLEFFCQSVHVIFLILFISDICLVSQKLNVNNC